MRIIEIIQLRRIERLNLNLFPLAKYNSREVERFDLRDPCLDLQLIFPDAEVIIHERLNDSSQKNILIWIQYATERVDNLS